MMIFIYETDSYPLKIYPQREKDLSTARLSKVVILDTDRQINILPRKIYHATLQVIKG